MSEKGTHWHQEADVIVVGYGAAGAAAAITAHDCGVEAVILEKQPSESHVTNSFMAGGAMICPNDVQGAIHYMEALSRVDENLYWTDPDTIKAWAVYTSQNKQWLERFGKSLKLHRQGGEHRGLPGCEAIDIYGYPGMGVGLTRMLYEQVASRGIPVMHQTPATRLVLDDSGGLVGVQAQSGGDGGRILNLRSRRGVILASGGFEFDEQLKLQYLRAYPAYFTGSPANTGDGIRLALGAGAQLWHMNCCSARLVMKPFDLPFAFDPAFGGSTWGIPGSGADGSTPKLGYIVVDRSGRRYTKETFKRHALYYELGGFDTQRMLYPRIPSYWIFDQNRIGDSPIVRVRTGPAGAARFYRWSEDNGEELERGWIKQGDTLKELALELSLDPQALEQSVRDYNHSCKTGVDRDFKREPGTLAPLTNPPYYGVELWPGGPNTQGGPRRNGKAQVLRPDNSPIPRLYSAGELGSVYGMLYPASGGNLAECIAFGRIAGENASEHSPL